MAENKVLHMIEFSWEDAIFAVGNVVFFVALIPSVMSADKPSIWTSAITGATLVAFSFTFFTLGFWFAMCASGLTALGWWTLFFQKLLSK